MGDKPSEQRGGAPTGENEAREKGECAAQAREGVVPAELGGSDAPEEQLADDSDLDDAVLGGPARSELELGGSMTSSETN